MLAFTKMKCLLENKQEKIDTLEKQVQDLQEDRKFLRTQIENLTSTLSAFVREGVTRRFQETWTYKKKRMDWFLSIFLFVHGIPK